MIIGIPIGLGRRLRMMGMGKKYIRILQMAVCEEHDT